MSTQLPDQVIKDLEEAERIEQSLTAQPEAQPEEPQQIQEPEPQPEPPKPQGEPEETWKQRYLSLKGMFDAEMPRMRGELKELQARLDAKEAPAPQPPEPAPKPEVQVSQKDIDDFGSDLIDVIRRVSSDAVTAAVGNVEAKLAALSDKLDQAASQTEEVRQHQGKDRQNRFFTRLAELVPDYVEVNANQEFLAWLGDVDPLSGQIRQQFLESAVRADDADRTANLFKEWKKAAGYTNPEPTPDTSPEQELAEQVQPGKASASVGHKDTPAQKIYTQAEVSKFYTDLARGEYRGREQEAQQIDKEIDAAAAEGRIR